jgi:hypothetical protein
MGRIHKTIASVAISVAAFSAPAVAQEFMQTTLGPGGRIEAVHARDFDGDGRIDLIVDFRREMPNGVEARFLRVYVGGGVGWGFTLHLERETPADAIAFGVGDLLGRGRPQLVYFTAASVVAIDPENGSPLRLLGDRRFFFNLPDADRSPLWDHVEDLNGDGRDDLIYPGPRGHEVYLQDADRRLVFAGAVESDFGFGAGAGDGRPPARDGERAFALQLGERADVDVSGIVRESRRAGAIVTRRQIARFDAIDLNADGRRDLISMKGDHLLAFLQRADGAFGPEPDRIDRLGASEKESFLDRVERAPIVHGDFDGDGRVEFVIAKVEPKELATRLSLYRWSAEGIDARPEQIVKLSGLSEAPRLVDVNGDGRRDLVCLTLEAERFLRAAAGDSVDVALSVYLFDAREGRFATRPSLRREISIPLRGEARRGSAPERLRLEGDFDGDGALDLLAIEAEELAVYPVRVKPGDPMAIELAPRATMRHRIGRARNLQIVDLNGDGRSEIVMHDAEAIVIVGAR